MRQHQIRHKDIMFAADFSNQQSSVSSALVRHDRQSNVDALKAEKTDMVKGIQVYSHPCCQISLTQGASSCRVYRIVN